MLLIVIFMMLFGSQAAIYICLNSIMAPYGLSPTQISEVGLLYQTSGVIGAFLLDCLRQKCFSN
jgi:hypothetical protein